MTIPIKTVAQTLTSAMDSVNVINYIKTGIGEDGESYRAIIGMSQSEINTMVDNNVKHLESVLAYDGTKRYPDVAGSSVDKSAYTTAITTGKNYITANS
tara:strand:+ start:1306 stop:1602 length:297 start_codon:yes stop_codon:yes gene_type:complete